MSWWKVRQHGIAWQIVDDELIVLDEVSSTYLKVAGAGTFLWPRLVDGVNESELVESLVNEFGLPTSQASSDVQVFMTELLDHQLVEQAAP